MRKLVWVTGGEEKGGVLYPPRTWDGTIRYELIHSLKGIHEPVEEPVKEPDEEPDKDLTKEPAKKSAKEPGKKSAKKPVKVDVVTCFKEVTTKYTAGARSFGNMFNVQTKSKETTVTDDLVGFDSWQLIASGNVIDAGSGVGTPIPSNHILQSRDSDN
eukprot:7795424-Ditylum_brightwellii.AAC.1